jgi:hypothetical protein
MEFTPVLDNWVISRLSEPFEAHELKWRPGAAGSFLAYIDARQVVERLNNVVGAENWYDFYQPIQFIDTEIKDVTNLTELKARAIEEKWNINENFWVNRSGEITSLKNKSHATFAYNNIHYGGIKCSLTVIYTMKEDVGTTSLADQMKGAHSDALKRAAVKFGIGSYLYDLKNIKGGYIERGVVIEPPELPEWALPKSKGNPDDAILALFEKAKNTEKINTYTVEQLYSKISVMGSYNHFAPLILKRYVYEELSSLIKKTELVRIESDMG